MKVRTRIGLVVAAVLALGALAGVALPHLVDVEAYRPAIVQAVKEATGRELVIDGPLQLSMFPQPRISARKVRFANAVGTKGAQMAAVEWIGVSPAWGLALPLIGAAYLLFTFQSAIDVWRGRGGMWKGRAQAMAKST